MTLKITAASLVLSCIFGLVTALFRLSESFAAKTLARLYMELVRNTPLLVQIFFIYFVVSPVLGMGRFFSAILALSLFEGAYASEIFRAGIVSIHKGQWEAAHSVGLNTLNTYRHIILPQAVRRMLPDLCEVACFLQRRHDERGGIGDRVEVSIPQPGDDDTSQLLCPVDQGSQIIGKTHRNHPATFDDKSLRRRPVREPDTVWNQ